MTATFFVDESKANGFRFALARVEHDEVESVRRSVRCESSSNAPRLVSRNHGRWLRLSFATMRCR